MPKTAQIKLYDEIGGWGIWFSDFERQLAQCTGDVEILIHSPGGDAFDGMAMANVVKAYDKGKVTGTVMGMCASAAGFVLAACDERQMYPATQLMIHEAASFVFGRETDLLDAARRLKDINQQQAEMFSSITGKPMEEILSLLAAETWYTPARAKADGFIHRIVNGQPKGIDAKTTAQWMARFKNVPEEWVQKAAPFRAAASAAPWHPKKIAALSGEPTRAKQAMRGTTMRSKKDLIGMMAAACALALATAQEAAEHSDEEVRKLADGLLDDDVLPKAMGLVMPLAQAEKVDEEADTTAKALFPVFTAAKKITGQQRGLVGALEAIKRNADGKMNASLASQCDALIKEGVAAVKFLPVEGEEYKAAVLRGERSIDDMESWVKASIPRGKGTSQQVTEAPAKTTTQSKNDPAEPEDDDEYVKAAGGFKALAPKGA